LQNPRLCLGRGRQTRFFQELPCGYVTFQRVLQLPPLCSRVTNLASEESKLPPVRIEKPSARPKADIRQKCCATCGRPFSLEPGQKFFDCPACYKKKMSQQKPKKTLRSRVLTQIQCASCGNIDFIGFVPDDPGAALCNPCFAKRVREQKNQKQHFHIVTGDA